MYKYKVTRCRNERNSGVSSQNEYYDSASASKCSPNMGQASCAGCTSVPGCLFSSQINFDPGRATMGICSSQADKSYSYRTPASCDSSGEANETGTSIWVAIIPLLLIIAYILNAIVVAIVAKKRGNTPKRYLYNSVSADFFIRQQPLRLVLHRLAVFPPTCFPLCVIVTLFSGSICGPGYVCSPVPQSRLWFTASPHYQLSALFLTAQQPARSTVVPITVAATSTAFVPPLPPYSQGGSAYPYNSHPAAYPPGSYPPPPGYSPQQQQPLVPHSTAYVATPAMLHLPPNPYVASPAFLQPPPNPYGAPVYSSKPA